jgi:hypothetical protein
MIKRKIKNSALKWVIFVNLPAISQVLLFSGCFLAPNYQDYVNSIIKPKRIRGIVIGKANEETGCYGLIIFKQAQEVDTLRKIFYCTPPVNGVWRYVEHGDSLFKEEGTLEVYVKRNGTAKKFIFATKVPL